MLTTPYFATMTRWGREDVPLAVLDSAAKGERDQMPKTDGTDPGLDATRRHGQLRLPDLALTARSYAINPDGRPTLNPNDYRP